MNLFKHLVSLLPSSPLQVATALSVDAATSTALVEMPGGALVKVRVAGFTPPINGRVYIRAGVIEGAAADKPLVTGTI